MNRASDCTGPNPAVNGWSKNRAGKPRECGCILTTNAARSRPYCVTIMIHLEQGFEKVYPVATAPGSDFKPIVMNSNIISGTVL